MFYSSMHQISVHSGCLSSLTCLGVEHQNVGSRPEQLLEVFVVADLLNERRHLYCVQHRQQPHLVVQTHTEPKCYHSSHCVIVPTHNQQGWVSTLNTFHYQAKCVHGPPSIEKVAVCPLSGQQFWLNTSIEVDPCICFTPLPILFNYGTNNIPTLYHSFNIKLH